MNDHYAGLDVGSTTTKAVIINEGGIMVGTYSMSSGTDLVRAAGECLKRALDAAGDPPPTTLVATGYGMTNVAGADQSITEISKFVLNHMCPSSCV